jgi:hypothetical protein
MKSYDIFISYRRDKGQHISRLIYEQLKNKYAIFRDTESLNSGEFRDEIDNAVMMSKNFILILTDGSLVKRNGNDVFIQEIKCAIKYNINIILVFDEGFQFPNQMPENILKVKDINGIQYSDFYFSAFIKCLQDRFILNNNEVLIDSPVNRSNFDDFVIENRSLVTYKGDNEIVIVPDEVEIIGKGVFENKTRIKQVYLGKSVKRISERAFFHCIKLEKLYMNTNLEIIDDEAFCRCMRLSELDLSANIKKIGAKSFAHCTSIKSLHLTRNIVSIASNSFFDCSELEVIDVHDDNMIYSAIDGVLYDKTFTKLLKCPDSLKAKYFIMPISVRCIGEFAFSYCNNIGSITIPPSVEHIEDFVFWYAIGLQELVIEGTKISLGKEIFSGFTKEQKIYLQYEIYAKHLKSDTFSACDAEIIKRRK